MSLRLRLALTTLAIVVPILAALVYFGRVAMENEGRQLLSELVVSHMESGGREACEASPETWRGVLFSRRGARARLEARPGPPNERASDEVTDDEDEEPLDAPVLPSGRPEAMKKRASFLARRAERRVPPVTTLFALDGDLRPWRPDAPPVVEAFRAEMADGRRVSKSRVVRARPRVVEMIVRMPWSEGPCAALLVRRPEREPPALGMLPPLQPLLVVLAVVLGAIMFAAGPMVRRIRALEREVRASAKEGYKTPLLARGRDEIAELARAFDEAGREVRAQIARQEQREKSLREFLANTTHDVNTPLTVLLGHLAELERELATEAHPEAKARVGAALRETHYMASLLHNLALAARLDAGEPDPRRDRVDLTPLVERAVSRHRALAERLEVALERAVPEGALWVLGDMTMIEQAASNLIQNAVRHHRQGGHVAVILEEARPGLFSFRVVDDGPGIPEEEIPRLLERNHRGREARTRDPGGLGLGLDITRRVAEHHGFTLALRRSEMGGLEAELTGALADA